MKICVLKNTCPVKILVLKSAVNKIAIGSLFNAKMVFLLFNLFFEINFILKRLSLSPRLSRGLSLPELQDYFRTKIQIFPHTKLYTYVIYIFSIFIIFFEKCRDRILVVNSASGQKASIFEWGEKENYIENTDFTYEAETSESLKK